MVHDVLKKYHAIVTSFVCDRSIFRYNAYFQIHDCVKLAVTVRIMSFDVNPKMRASFSRAICVRVARTFNLAVRCMQLSAAARVLLFLLLLFVLLMRLWLDGPFEIFFTV